MARRADSVKARHTSLDARRRLHEAGFSLAVDTGLGVAAPLTFGACALPCEGQPVRPLKHHAGPKISSDEHPVTARCCTRRRHGGRRRRLTAERAPGHGHQTESGGGAFCGSVSADGQAAPQLSPGRWPRQPTTAGAGPSRGTTGRNRQWPTFTATAATVPPRRPRARRVSPPPVAAPRTIHAPFRNVTIQPQRRGHQQTQPGTPQPQSMAASHAGSGTWTGLQVIALSAGEASTDNPGLIAGIG